MFSPGNLESCSALAGVDFSLPILEAIEHKVTITDQYASAFDAISRYCEPGRPTEGRRSS